MSCADGSRQMDAGSFDPGLSTTEPSVDASSIRQASLAGGLGGGSPSQRGARGAEPARIRKAECPQQREREGQRPLASAKRSVSSSGEREGRSPLASAKRSVSISEEI